MSLLKAVFAHEWRLFRRNRLLVGGLLFLLLAGGYGLWAGYSFSAAQRTVLRGIDADQAVRRAKHLARYHADTLTEAGKRDYRWAHDAVVTDRELGTIVYQPLHPLAGLSIGQRDVYPYYYAVLPWDNIYLSKSAEIRNPDKLLAGNFDLAFVLIYLVPLFVIAYGHNVLAEEQEQHTYALVRVQAGSVRAVVSYKLLFRFGLTLAAVWALSGAGFGLNQVPAAQAPAMLSWLLVGTLYVGFWFAWVYAVAALARSAAFSALALLGLWLLFILLIPSVLNFGLGQRQTDPTALRQVSLGREKDSPWYWSLPRLKAAFYQRAPQFSGPRFAAVRDTFELRFLAYVVLTEHQKNTLGAAQDQEQAALYRQTLRFNLVNPAFTALNACNQLAQTELSDHQHFVRAVLAYQEARRNVAFDYDLSGQPFGQAQLGQFPVFRYQPAPASLGRTWRATWPLLLWALGLGLVGYRRLARIG
jgi:ABC-2 type transport system permease protein